MPITFEEIKRRFEAEQAQPITPMTAADMPPTYESITPAWLTDVLGSAVAGAEVLSHKLGPRDDGTSNRRFIAIEWNEAGQQAGLPRSVFCKRTQSLEIRYRDVLTACRGTGYPLAIRLHRMDDKYEHGFRTRSAVRDGVRR
ncbi:MAG: hypothetical protein WD928_01080 [Gammaproteobacteria bacterium]